ncbi:ECM5 [Candida theae]|uniref:ECM5 n=1 Tax=Candida theae TaxID=1198502 RepID=A0AAD5BC94_9ASCO|nr:ECM5 [Candida theae]KAI5954756.1 ECM5 [Candida theae]
MALYSTESGSPHDSHSFYNPHSTPIDNQISTFPKSSRFFDTSTLPDLKHLEVSDDVHHQVLFNGQVSNFNYSPFNISQQKLKASPAINYDSIPNKFAIAPTSYQEENEIPFLRLSEEQAKDPISFIDNLRELGSKYGAVKVKLPSKDEKLFQTTNQVNSDLFWFHTNKLLNNPTSDELLVRLEFHRNLLQFHQSDQHNYFEDVDATRAKEKNGTANLQFHLNKLPMIDKRPLDLYKLYQSVIIRGGFIEVINKKLWAQIGRELGYKGKIMTSLSSSLKASYQKILYPYELYLANRSMGLVKEEQSTLETLSSGSKRNIQPIDTPEKKQRADNRYYAPRIVGSEKQFKRQLNTKVSKGMLANSPHLIDVKQPNTYVVKQTDKKRNKKAADKVTAFITPQASLQAGLSYIRDHQDESCSTDVPKIASSYTLRQFMEKDIKFQEHIIHQNRHLFCPDASQRDCIKFQDLENLYWRYARNTDIDSVFSNGIELEMGKDLPTSVHGSGFVRIGDDIANFKNALNNHLLSLSHAKSAVNSKNPNTTPHVFSQQNPWDFNRVDNIDQTIESALYPWNLHNFATLPNAILGTLNQFDVGNQELTETRVNVGMTFSTENWTCEDHFTQLINYHFFGAPKRWYFIPESEFDKFERLVKDVNTDLTSSSAMSRNEISRAESVSTALFRSSNEELETDLVIKAIENSVNTKADHKLPHRNVRFANLCQRGELLLNQDLRITPELLDYHNIRYTTTVQHPGEFIIKFPKTYSSAQSYGFNFTEETNFASSLWLDYALHGEKWLTKQGILSNFSIFKLLITVASIYDNGGSISFNSDVFSKVANLYKGLYLKEIELRDQIRKLKVKETNVTEESLSDIIADDDYGAAFPSRVMITDVDSKDSMFVSMENFLHYSSSPEFMENFVVELQLFHSDEKLKTFHKVLSEYSVDFESWIQNYESLMAEGDEIPLKQYKVLLNEGDKINSSISSTSVVGGQSYDQQRMRVFGEYLENLRYFTTSASQFIEECQNVLALKHQQRIRNGQDLAHQERAFSLKELASLVERISSLNFTCPEIEQILELKTEIQNFDKASRSLIAKKGRSLQEFDDLISLGESFGLDIPSLDFIIRIRNRLRWIKTYNLIEKGVDPFSDRKEVFSIDDLKEFYNSGLELLAAGDLEYIQSIEVILNQSIVFNNDVRKFLQYTFVHDLDVEKLRSIVDSFTSEKLFLSSENYSELSKVHSSLELITRYKDTQGGGKLAYHELKQLYNGIIDSGLKFETSSIQESLQKTECWSDLQWQKLEKVRIITTINNTIARDSVNPKFTFNAKLVEKVQRLVYKCEFSLSIDDKFEESSSFVSHQENEHDDPKYYCVCREYEHGTMVECDECKEWYHVQCVKDFSKPKEEIYKCPICLLLSSGETEDKYLMTKLSMDELIDMYNDGEALEAVPVNEMTAMKDLIDILNSYSRSLNLNDVLNEPNEQTRFEKLMFVLRKLYGCGVQITDLFQKVLRHTRLAQQDIVAKKKQSNAQSVPAMSEETTQQQLETGTGGAIETELTGKENGIQPMTNWKSAMRENGIEASHANGVEIGIKDNKSVVNFHPPNESTQEIRFENGVNAELGDRSNAHASQSNLTTQNHAGSTNFAFPSENLSRVQNLSSSTNTSTDNPVPVKDKSTKDEVDLQNVQNSRKQQIFIGTAKDISSQNSPHLKDPDAKSAAELSH